MKRTTRLRLDREVIGELSPADLTKVVGAQDTITAQKAVCDVISEYDFNCDGQKQSCCSCTAVSDTVQR